jgi:HEAT repeat protein
MLEANNEEDAYLRHAGSLALARIGKAEPVVALSGHPSRALRIAAVVTLRRMRHPGIAAFLADADEFVVTEAARAINDDLSIPEALPALGDVLRNTRFTNEPLLRRAINANLRVGSEKALQNLVAYAQRDDSPANMRAEAVEALSTWAKPSVVDRVDGRYRGVVTRDPQPVRKEVAPALAKLVSHQDQALRLGAINGQLANSGLRGNSEALFARLQEDKESEIRVAALRAPGRYGRQADRQGHPKGPG